MVIFQAHKQMDFIYDWKIKQFNNWCLHDLLKQQVATGDLQNIVAIIFLNLHIVYLVAFSWSQQQPIVAFCRRDNCYVQVSTVNVYCSSAHIMLYLNVFSVVHLQIRTWVYML